MEIKAIPKALKNLKIKYKTGAVKTYVFTAPVFGYILVCLIFKLIKNYFSSGRETVSLPTLVFAPTAKLTPFLSASSISAKT